MPIRSVRDPLSIAAVMLLVLASVTQAQEPSPTRTPPPLPSQSHIGIDAFGGAGLTWPAAADSFEATGIGSRSFEVGGGARITGLWRFLFAQVAVHRWNETGERVFVDSTGARFPLGIPLDVEGTFVDVSAGWKSPTVTSAGRTALWSYIAAGAGVAMYSEESPFAEAGENIDSRSISYHLLGGVEIPIVQWLAVALDVRYRFVPDLLGEDGVSGALGEDVLGGFQTGAGLRIGFGGPRPRSRAPSTAKPPAEARTPFDIPVEQPSVETGILLDAAPVYLLPNPKRVPLRTLEAGSSVRVLEDAGDWLRIEFSDPQFGPRVGYVQRTFVQIVKK